MSPWAAPRRCPGRCSRLIVRGQRRCLECERRYERRRASDPVHRFHGSALWKKARAEFLAAHPQCSVAACLEPANQVDHRVSLRAGGDPFAWSNLVPYCLRQHSAKGATSGERWPQ
jgi:hypothetical protein